MMSSTALIVLLGLCSFGLTSARWPQIADKVCARIDKADCSKFPTREICDNNGGKYDNRCGLLKAICKDRTLRPRRCSDEETEESFESYMKPACKKILSMNCKKMPKKVMCDSKGKMHMNKCALLQAMCKDKTLKPAKCADKETESFISRRFCDKIASVNCTEKETREVCDNKGGRHQNKCALTQAMCKDRSLRPKICKDQLCEKVMALNCTQQRGREVCDSNGGRYQNKCAFMQAWCEDDELKGARCPDKETDTYVPRSMCDRIASVNCTERETKEVCDNKGGRHQNPCAFTQAMCKDSSLRPMICKNKLCEFVMALNCTQQRGREMCDNKGGRYQNRCAFTQAWCEDDDLKPARCTDEEDLQSNSRPPRPSGRPPRPSGRPPRPSGRPPRPSGRPPRPSGRPPRPSGRPPRPSGRPPRPSGRPPRP